MDSSRNSELVLYCTGSVRDPGSEHAFFAVYERPPGETAAGAVLRDEFQDAGLGNRPGKLSSRRRQSTGRPASGHLLHRQEDLAVVLFHAPSKESGSRTSSVNEYYSSNVV